MGWNKNKKERANNKARIAVVHTHTEGESAATEARSLISFKGKPYMSPGHHCSVSENSHMTSAEAQIGAFERQSTETMSKWRTYGRLSFKSPNKTVQSPQRGTTSMFVTPQELGITVILSPPWTDILQLRLGYISINFQTHLNWNCLCIQSSANPFCSLTGHIFSSPRLYSPC